MSNIPAISGVDDATQARVVLWHSGRQVHAPALGIGLQPAGSYQPLDPMLTALAGLVTVADNGLYFTGPDAPALFTLTAFARTLLDDATAIAARSTLGVAWELIFSGGASGVASIDITGLSAFDVLRFRFTGTTNTDNNNVGIRVSSNNGAAWDSGAADYGHQTTRASGVTVAGAASSQAAHFLMQGNTLGNAANEQFDTEIVLSNFNKASRGLIRSRTLYNDTTGAFNMTMVDGWRAANTARDAVQLVTSSGTITGPYRLEGLRG